MLPILQRELGKERYEELATAAEKLYSTITGHEVKDAGAMMYMLGGILGRSLSKDDAALITGMLVSGIRDGQELDDDEI